MLLRQTKKGLQFSKRGNSKALSHWTSHESRKESEWRSLFL